MSNDERPDSLAAQAASWVPPWEREPRPPDREYQAAAEAAARAEPADDEELSEAGLADDDDDFDPAGGYGLRDETEPEAVDEPDESTVDDGLVAADDGPEADDERADVDGLEADDERADVDGREAGGSGAGDEPDPVNAAGVEAETAALDDGDEAAAVDSPAVVRGEPAPCAAEVGPELPLPDAVEEAAEQTVDDDQDGVPADAPLPPDGDDAGELFDLAADDDVSDDGELDLPFVVDEAAARPPTQPEATSIVDPGRAATTVPEQGRRRRDDRDAVGDGDARTKDDAEPTTQSDQDDDLPALLDDAELAAALEAIMLVVDEPVAEMQLAQILEQPTERVGAMLEDLSARYTAAGHGFDLRRAAGGWRLYTRPEYAAYVERFVLDGQSVRLTQAALETLAVVAYKQPVTRSRISAIRGVNCDGVMRTLVTRGLIEECGTEGETGAYLYRTTPLFLEKLGLNSVDQLPPLAPFLPDDVEEVLDAPG